MGQRQSLVPCQEPEQEMELIVSTENYKQLHPDISEEASDPSPEARLLGICLSCKPETQGTEQNFIQGCGM